MLERETGFEPATLTLARLHSTTELFPRTASYMQEVFVCQETIPSMKHFLISSRHGLAAFHSGDHENIFSTRRFTLSIDKIPGDITKYEGGTRIFFGTRIIPVTREFI